MTEDLNEYSIYVLREMARQAGVVSPTSKKKEQLISEITEIRSGMREPVFAKRQGRPPKTTGYSISLDVTKNIFNTPLEFCEEPTDPNDVRTEFGYIEPVNNGSALLWITHGHTYEKMFVNNELVTKYDLKYGDEVFVRIEPYDGQIKVRDILSINGIAVCRMKTRAKYDEIVHTVPTRKIEFDMEKYSALDLKYGESVYLYGNDNNINTSTMVEMIKSCRARHKIYINVSIAGKNEFYLDSLGEETRLYIAKAAGDVDESRRIVDLAIEYAKRIIELGEDVVVAVDDVQSIASLDQSMTKMKNLMTLTKNAEGSISIFAIMSNNNLGVIDKLADKKFEINAI